MDALAKSSQPIVFSHTGVKALHEGDRYVTDDEIRTIAAGGIGIWPARARHHRGDATTQFTVLGFDPETFDVRFHVINQWMLSQPCHQRRIDESYDSGYKNRLALNGHAERSQVFLSRFSAGPGDEYPAATVNAAPGVSLLEADPHTSTRCCDAVSQLLIAHSLPR
jgi:hypothetical protein